LKFVMIFNFLSRLRQDFQKQKRAWPLVALGVLIALGQGLALFGLYFLLAAVHGASLIGAISFIIIFLLFFGAGAWWWGRTIDGETSLAPRMLAALLLLSAAWGLFWPQLINLSLWLETLLYPWGGGEVGGKLLWAKTLSFAPLAGFGFFAGGAVPLLIVLGAGQKKSPYANISHLKAWWLFGLTIACPLSVALLGRTQMAIWAGLSLLAASSLFLLWGWGKIDKSRPWRFKFWPSPSLGLWRENNINVLEHDLAKKTARHAWLLFFISSFCAVGAVLLWCRQLGVLFVHAPMFSLTAPFLVALTLIVLGCLSTPKLLKKASLTALLPLLVSALAACLTLFPFILSRVDFMAYGASLWHQPAFWLLLSPLLILGALGPLAAYFFYLRHQWLGSGVGLGVFWLAGGAAGALIFVASDFVPFYKNAQILGGAALVAAALAFSFLVGRTVALAGFALLGAMVYFLPVPFFSPDFVPPYALAQAKENQLLGQYERFETSWQLYENPPYVVLNGAPYPHENETLKSISLLADAWLTHYQPNGRDLAPVLAADQFGVLGGELVALGRRVTMVGPLAPWPLKPNLPLTIKPFLQIEGNLPHFFLMTKEKYALILSGSQGQNPKANHLWAYDFYRLSARQLEHNGLMVQIINTHNVPPQNIHSELLAFAQNFPHTTVWAADNNFMVLIGSPQKLSEGHFDLISLVDNSQKRWGTLISPPEPRAVENLKKALMLSPPAAFP
ncbi:MAG: hypothetical protein ACRCTY_01760, partial [Candidatus Adiutrix sp.]